MIWRHLGDAEFVLNFNPQFSHSFDINRLAMVLMAMNGEQQIGNEACKNLYHQAIATSCNQMVDAQMAFPPGKEVFDVPPELIGLSYLFGRQISAICGYPVISAINVVSDQPYRFL